MLTAQLISQPLGNKPVDQKCAASGGEGESQHYSMLHIVKENLSFTIVTL